MPETFWSTVDRLIHDLGAIRAFVDEADAMPEASAAPEVAAVRGAMDAATDAITHLFTDTEAPALQAAWIAIARAQDAVAQARDLIADARESQEAAERMRQLNRKQAARALEQREELRAQMQRLGNRQPLAVEDSAVPDPAEPPPSRPRSKN